MKIYEPYSSKIIELTYYRAISASSLSQRTSVYLSVCFALLVQSFNLYIDSSSKIHHWCCFSFPFCALENRRSQWNKKGGKKQTFCTTRNKWSRPASVFLASPARKISARYSREIKAAFVCLRRRKRETFLLIMKCKVFFTRIYKEISRGTFQRQNFAPFPPFW